VGEFASFCDTESYAGGSVATGRGHPSQTGQRVEARRRETPWSSRLRVGRKANNLAPEKNPLPLKILNYGKPDGRIIDNQSEYQRIRTKNIYLGTWNVLTMLQPGKMQEVAEQILQSCRSLPYKK
jgi:hypothetical protein